jgi:hypothetical protein
LEFLAAVSSTNAQIPIFPSNMTFFAHCTGVWPLQLRT